MPNSHIFKHHRIIPKTLVFLKCPVYFSSHILCHFTTEVFNLYHLVLNHSQLLWRYQEMKHWKKETLMLVLSMLNWKDISSSWVKYLKIVLLQVRIQISSFWGIHGDSFEATFQVKNAHFLLFWCWKYVNVKKCFLLSRTICNCLSVLQKYYALNSNLFENLWAFLPKVILFVFRTILSTSKHMYIKT